MSDFLKTLQSLIAEAAGSDPPGGPPRPLILVGIDGGIASLTNLQFAPGGGGIDDWLSNFRSIFEDVALRETLVIRVLQLKLPRVAEALTLAGAITVPQTAWIAGALAPHHFAFDWVALKEISQRPGPFYFERLTRMIGAIADLKAAEVLLLLLLSGPDELVRLEYAHKGFLALPVAEHPGVDLAEVLAAINSPVGLALPPPPGDVALGGLKSPPQNGTWGALVVDSPAPGALEVSLQSAARTGLSGAVKLGEGWELQFDGRASAANPVLRLRVTGAGIDRSVTPPNVAFGVYLAPIKEAGTDAFLIGDPNGTHFAIGKVRAGVRFAVNAGDPAFGYVIELDPVRFQVSADLLKSVAMGLPIPGTISFESAVETSFLQGVGLAAQGAKSGPPGLGVEFSKHLGLAIGGSSAGLWVDDILTRIEIAFPGKGIAVRVVFRFGARAALGPVKATMTGAGLWLGPWVSGSAGIEPPTGVGITLEAGPVSGGGFLAQYGPGKFGGALQLKVLGIGVFAYGLYEETPAGVSIAAIIGIRLPLPGIQLGFGFAVSGFGGLIGINRRADLDALRDRLQSGSAGDVLFTENPVKNAPRLLGDMDAILPREDGVHVFGPTLQLNWAQLLKLDLGLFIELPGPRKIFVAGSARLIIGSEDFALVALRLDFIGGVDLTASLIFFDGMLVDSSVLGIIRITGGIALRIGFGGNPYFLFSVGGFHPGFNPGNLPVPAIPRAGAGVDLGIVWFKQEMYLAITSNTLQFGSRTEAGVEIGPISVHGWFAFDALIQYRPFYFDAAVDAGMEASFDGWSFASIRVQGRLTGPGPLVLSASATVCLIFEISKDVTITIDDNPPERITATTSLAKLLEPEARNNANMRVEGADDDVVFTSAEGVGGRLVPTGTIIWEQKRVPLALAVQRAEGLDLAKPQTVTVTVPGFTTTPEYDLFGHGTFAKLTDADALAAPTFIEEQSGFRLTSTLMTSASTPGPLSTDIRIHRIPERRTFSSLHMALLGDAFGTMTAERVGGAKVAHEAPAVAVIREQTWSVAGGAAASGLSAGGAFTAARLSGGAAIAPGADAVSLGGIV